MKRKCVLALCYFTAQFDVTTQIGNDVVGNVCHPFLPSSFDLKRCNLKLIQKVIVGMMKVLAVLLRNVNKQTEHYMSCLTEGS